MLFEGILREAVKRDRGHGAFLVRSSDAPYALGATPASKVIAFDPYQSFVHTTSYACVWDWKLERDGRNAEIRSNAKGELLPVAAEYFPRIRNRAK